MLIQRNLENIWNGMIVWLTFYNNYYIFLRDTESHWNMYAVSMKLQIQRIIVTVYMIMCQYNPWKSMHLWPKISGYTHSYWTSSTETNTAEAKIKSLEGKKQRKAQFISFEIALKRCGGVGFICN